MSSQGYSKGHVPEERRSNELADEAQGTVPRTGRSRSAAPPPFDSLPASGSSFELEYYDPPTELAAHILTLFHFTWDRAHVADRHPGALSQLVLFPFGQGTLNHADGIQPVTGEAHMFAGFSVAQPFTMEGPWHAIGASLSALGWAALTGRPASDHLDRFIPAVELLGEEIDRFARAINDRYRADTLSGKDACFALADWIAERLRSIPPEHEALISHTVAWLGTSLNPDVDQLFEGLDYSRRQTERLVKRYFGFNPAALARKFRAVRAASLLSQEDLTDEGEAEIAAAFYDQPHMIREIRRYCGYTPTRLGGPADPLFQTMLRLKNLDRLKDFRKIG